MRGANRVISLLVDLDDVDAATPATGEVLVYNGSKWVPGTNSALPSGSAGGDLTGDYPNPTLANIVTAGTYTKVTIDAKGRVTAGTTLTTADLPTGIPNANLTNSSITITAGTGLSGGGTVSLGGTVTLSSTVTAPVSSVANSDGTLTISPTTGDVVASLNLAKANTWTATQTFQAQTSGIAAVFRAAATTPGNIANFSNSAGTVFSAVNSSGQFLVRSDLDASQPGYAFKDDPTTGILYGNGGLQFVVAGVALLSLEDDFYVQHDNGAKIRTNQNPNSASLPAYTFNHSPTTGFFSTGAFVGVSLATVEVMRFTNATQTGLMTIPTAALKGFVVRGAASQSGNLIELQNSSETTLSSITSAGIFTAPLGSAAAPGYTFLGDTNTGFYRVAADVIGISANGIAVFSINANGMTGAGSPGAPYINAYSQGSADSPAYSFDDTIAGMFAPGADALGFTTNSLERLRIDANGLVGVNKASSIGAQLHVVAGSASTVGALFDAAASQTANMTQWRNSSGTAYVTIGPPTLANDGTQNWLNLTGTLPSANTAAIAPVRLAFTSAGSAAFRNECVYLTLAAGYTGSNRISGMRADISSASTGTALGFGNDDNPDGNAGYLAYTNGTTTGNNFGYHGLAKGGDRNFGGVFKAVVGKTNAWNIGVAGIGRNTTTANHIGGWFSLAGDNTPTFVSAALVATNGDRPEPIFLGRDNTTTVFTIADGGDVTIAPVVRTTGSPTLFTLTGPAHTTLTASTEATDINLNLARTVQFATATPTTQRAFRIQAPTYSCDTASQTITTGVTLDVSGAPAAGTNVTITNQIGARFNAGVAAGIPIVAQGASAQTGDLQQWRNSSGTVLARIDANGLLTLNQGTASSTTILSFVASSNFNSSSTVYGIQGRCDQSGTGDVIGAAISARARPSGTVNNAIGISGQVEANTASTTLTTAIALRAQGPNIATTPTLTNTYGLQVHNQGHAQVVNAYGIYVLAQTGASSINYAAVLDGTVGVGKTSGLSARLHVQGAASGVTAIFQGNATTPGNLTEWQNSSGTAYLTVGPPTLAGDSATKNWLNLTATLPTTLTAATIGVRWDVTTAGSSAQDITGVANYLNAGYTGGNTVIASYASNAVAGTGASTLTGGAGNYGFYGIASATTAGDNVGGFFKANGGNLSVGVTGCANVNKASAVNVGVIGIGQNGGAGANHIGGLFQVGQNSVPAVSAGLVVTNGSFVVPIALFRDDTVTVLTIADGGTVTATGQVRMASLGVGNSAAATTPGSVTKKIEVFDTAGASLGFVPVYDAIT